MMSTAASSPDFWTAMTVAGSAVTTYMGVTWYRVKTGRGRPRRSYLAYLTTEKYRAMWERQKTQASYYSIRLWIALGWTIISLLKATHPGLR
jgi:hypothetical protein